MADLPFINLDNINTSGENDMIIFVKDVGVVFVEIKTSSASNNITKGIHQIQNIENFDEVLFTTGFTTGFSTGFAHHHTRGENDMIIFVKDVVLYSWK